MKFINGQKTSIKNVNPIGVMSIKNGKFVSNSIPNADDSYMAAKIDVEFDSKNGALGFMVIFNDKEYIVCHNQSIMQHLDLGFTKKDKEILENSMFPELV